MDSYLRGAWSASRTKLGFLATISPCTLKALPVKSLAQTISSGCDRDVVVVLVAVVGVMWLLLCFFQMCRFVCV